MGGWIAGRELGSPHRVLFLVYFFVVLVEVISPGPDQVRTPGPLRSDQVK